MLRVIIFSGLVSSCFGANWWWNNVVDESLSDDENFVWYQIVAPPMDGCNVGGSSTYSPYWPKSELSSTDEYGWHTVNLAGWTQLAKKIPNSDLEFDEFPMMIKTVTGTAVDYYAPSQAKASTYAYDGATSITLGQMLTGCNDCFDDESCTTSDSAPGCHAWADDLDANYGYDTTGSAYFRDVTSYHTACLGACEHNFNQDTYQNLDDGTEDDRSYIGAWGRTNSASTGYSGLFGQKHCDNVDVPCAGYGTTDRTSIHGAWGIPVMVYYGCDASDERCLPPIDVDTGNAVGLCNSVECTEEGRVRSRKIYCETENCDDPDYECCQDECAEGTYCGSQECDDGYMPSDDAPWVCDGWDAQLCDLDTGEHCCTDYNDSCCEAAPCDGDLNGDGEADILDAVQLVQIIVYG